MNAVYGLDGYVVSSPAIAARKGCSTLKSRCGGSGSLGTTTVSWYGRRSPIAQTRSEYVAARSCNLRTSESSTALLEICPRGNNKVGYYHIFILMINVYIPCYNCINRKH